MARRLIFWDVDGTLLTAGSIGRQAIERGVRLASGREELPEPVMSGKTDPQIVRENLVSLGFSAEEVEQLIPIALEEAERALRELAPRIAGEGRVHPGVREALAAFEKVGVRQSLVTGNILPNAHVKLSAFGLDRWLDFSIGAFGSDHVDRNMLVPIALERAREKDGINYEGSDTWVIGDTARDLACARAAGVRCILVGTGVDGFAGVSNLGADVEIEELTDTAGLLQKVLGSSSSGD